MRKAVERFREHVRKTRWWPREFVWVAMPGWPDEGRRIVQRHLLESLIAQARENTTGFKRVLNAGAGEGLFTDLLLSIPGMEAAIELDVVYRTNRRAPLDLRQQTIAASLTQIPLCTNCVDFILCSEVLEHITDDEGAVVELIRVLRPGGSILISVPTPPAVYDPAHVREGYSYEDLRELLNSHGLDVVVVQYCMYQMFRLMLGIWRRAGWMPRGLIRGLAAVDRLVPFGRPMDLIVLARLRM